ncbi:MAG: hypothetical protein ACTSP4_12915 [Candidatus Hodarchaeales archaeon]
MMVPRKPFFEVLTEVQAVLGDENPKVMAKVGMSLGQKWAESKKEAGVTPSSVRELFDMVADYLQNDLQFAQKVDVMQDKNRYELKFGIYDSDECQCILCCGSMVKKKGGVPACPVSQFMMGVYRIFKKDLGITKIQLEGIQKPASMKPGSCDQKFIVETK